MSSVLRVIPLQNALVITIYDLTRLYYGDFHIVKLEITCPVSIHRELFDLDADFTDACRLLGDKVVYRRTVEQLGVPSTEIERVQQKLIDTFSDNSLRYFSSPDFPAKLVKAELKKFRKRLMK